MHAFCRKLLTIYIQIILEYDRNYPWFTAKRAQHISVKTFLKNPCFKTRQYKEEKLCPKYSAKVTFLCFFHSSLLQEVVNIGNIQHGFMEGKSCFTNRSTFNNEMISLVDGGIAVDVPYVDFYKVFNPVLSSYTSQLCMGQIGGQ